MDSRTKLRIAKLFADTGERLTVSDVSRRLGISKSRSSVCLRDLNKKGILEKRAVGRSSEYKLSSNNLANSIAESLTKERDLLLDIEKELVKRAMKTEPVSIVLFGSSLNGLRAGRDIDFLLIHKGRIDERGIYKIIAGMTEEYGFHISVLTMNLAEFIKKAKAGEEFVLNVLANHKLIHGKELEELVW